MTTPRGQGRGGAIRAHGRRLPRVSSRPAVDVVLPFRGSDVALERVAERLGALDLRPGDSVTIADNRPGAVDGWRGPVRILAAPGLRTSYNARNQGVARGAAPWLVFLDADVHPPADLLDRYFARPPGEEVGVLAGAVIDEAPPADGTATAAERYAWLKSSMSQEVTLAHGEYAFAQTANAAVRRVALERAGGFEPGVRSGGDADMCFRVRAAGLGARAARGGRGHAPQPRHDPAHARPARAPRRGRGVARASLAGRAAAPQLAGPRVVERAPRRRRGARRRARRS